ncbi:MAG: DUF3368 domain-containing protein [Chloroflexota bacterium]|nr:DUF3368 domain-containing protein [Chloroflexota bacterium]
MAERLVAADASPLIGLAAAGAFHLLRTLFDQITVTATVRDEVLVGRQLPGAMELAEAIRDGWINVVDVEPDLIAFANLDAGEASTLTLAIRHGRPCLVLMDEPAGRTYAQRHGITVTGLAGMLVEAKNARLTHSVRPLLNRLRASGFRLSDEIIRAILEKAGED